MLLVTFRLSFNFVTLVTVVKIVFVSDRQTGGQSGAVPRLTFAIGNAGYIKNRLRQIKAGFLQFDRENQQYQDQGQSFHRNQ